MSKIIVLASFHPKKDKVNEVKEDKKDLADKLFNDTLKDLN